MLALFALFSLGACLATGDGGLVNRDPPPAAPYDPLDADIPRNDVDLGDSFALEALFPTHGSFRGGTRVVLSGRGFVPKLEVLVGGNAVDPSQLVASSSTRAAILVPPHAPGFVDVTVRDPATARMRTLPRAFLYEALVVDPHDGATSGGTRIALTGAGTQWAAGAKVLIGGAACNDVIVDGPTSIHCTTPPSSLGARDVTVDQGAGAPADTAREAYTYDDAPDGYRGGLSGGALSGRLRVVVMSNYTGEGLPDAWVTLGSDLATDFTKKTANTGAVEFSSSTLQNKVTVTAAAKCHSPTTFVDVTVDTVVVYLDPIFDPNCAKGDPGSGGGGGGSASAGQVTGEIIFAQAGEFKKGGFTGVPAPASPTERQAAYVFFASASPRQAFNLPGAGSAITPSTPGTNGYGYYAANLPSNVTIYALAGLEDRSVTPAVFTAYIMGVTSGIRITAGGMLTNVDISMNIPIDHAITVAPSLPPAGARGPDRFSVQAALTLGPSSYAILPQGSKTITLPTPATLSLVGIPALANAVALQGFVISANASTGRALAEPQSVISRLLTRQTNETIPLTGFLAVPVPVVPAAGSWSGNRITFTGSGTADLHYIQVSGSLTTWTIAAPGIAFDFPLPDLRLLPGDPSANGAMRPGSIQTRIYRARVDDFTYSRLRYGNFSAGTWSAYASDAVVGAF